MPPFVHEIARKIPSGLNCLELFYFQFSISVVSNLEITMGKEVKRTGVSSGHQKALQEKTCIPRPH